MPIALALATLLVFARGLLAGQSFYFRDLAGYFFPLRRFMVLGLWDGHVRYWNPLIHEGVPLALPAIGYPPDLLQMLWPSMTGLSFLLALHVPLAALGAYFLARHLGLGPAGAGAAAVSYALGGFALSSLNLYVYLQALAWAPFVIRGFRCAAAGSGRDVAKAAALVAVAIATTGAEIVAQAIGVGIMLAWPRDLSAAKRLGLVVLLGFGLASTVTLPLSALVADSARGSGFATGVVLAHSVHPITLVQTLVAGLYGDTARFTDSFWGQNYFPRGFPYFLSLYLGVLALGLALRGAAEPRGAARVLAVLGVVGLVVSLGRYAGLEPLVEALPALHRFRFPSKAFFTVHLATALLLGFGLDTLGRRAEPRAWRQTGFLLIGLGAAVALVPWLALRAPGLRHYLLTGFFPSELGWPDRFTAAAAILRDAATGGVFGLGAGLVALLAARRLVAPSLACWLIVALLGGDLLRAGSGLNPTVSPAFFAPSPEGREIAREVREGGGRLFTFDAGYTPAYFAARATRRDHEVWSFAVLQETLVPSFNLELGVPTALSLDQTMLVPEARILPPAEAGPAALPRVLARLRSAAVTHVLSVEPLSHPELELLPVPSSPRIAPLQTRLYRLHGAIPRIELLGQGSVLPLDLAPDRLRFEVVARSDARLIVRDAWARGWTASVDAAPATVQRHGGGHRAVAVPEGRHLVELRYFPPGLRNGLAIALASAIVTAALWVRPGSV